MIQVICKINPVSPIGTNTGQEDVLHKKKHIRDINQRTNDFN
jgi:hypothetical protein